MKIINTPWGKGSPKGLNFFPDRRPPIWKKKPYSLASGSLTTLSIIEGGWVVAKSKPTRMSRLEEMQTMLRAVIPLEKWR